MEISPQTIHDMQYDFKLSTGYFSKQMLSSSDEVTSLLQVITSNPMLQQQFDVPSLLSYVMSLRGFKDMEQFIVQAPAVPAGQPGQGSSAGNPAGAVPASAMPPPPPAT